MKNLPIGIDIVRHKDTSKKIRFIKINALEFLGKTKEKFDVILFKQSIHFFTYKEIKNILGEESQNLIIQLSYKDWKNKILPLNN